jgi:hypothetical protein
MLLNLVFFLKIFKKPQMEMTCFGMYQIFAIYIVLRIITRVHVASCFIWISANNHMVSLLGPHMYMVCWVIHERKKSVELSSSTIPQPITLYRLMIRRYNAILIDSIANVCRKPKCVDKHLQEYPIFLPNPWFLAR